MQGPGETHTPILQTFLSLATPSPYLIGYKGAIAPPFFPTRPPSQRYATLPRNTFFTQIHLNPSCPSQHSAPPPYVLPASKHTCEACPSLGTHTLPHHSLAYTGSKPLTMSHYWNSASTVHLYLLFCAPPPPLPPPSSSLQSPLTTLQTRPLPQNPPFPMVLPQPSLLSLPLPCPPPPSPLIQNPLKILPCPLHPLPVVQSNPITELPSAPCSHPSSPALAHPIPSLLTLLPSLLPCHTAQHPPLGPSPPYL